MFQIKNFKKKKKRKDYCPPYFSFIAADLLTLNTQAPDVIHAYFSNNKMYTLYLKIHKVHISAILDLLKTIKRNPTLRLKLINKIIFYPLHLGLLPSQPAPNSALAINENFPLFCIPCSQNATMAKGIAEFTPKLNL